MRKVLIAIAVIVVVIIAGAAIFVATFDVNKYRGTIQAQLQQHLGRPVQLGDMHLKLFPPSITVQNLVIADDPRFSSDTPFVKASELDVSVKLLPLLHKDVEVESLNLQKPTVSLIKNKAGKWNFASLGHPEETGNPASPQQGSASPKPAPTQPPPTNSLAQAAPQSSRRTRRQTTTHNTLPRQAPMPVRNEAMSPDLRPQLARQTRRARWPLPQTLPPQPMPENRKSEPPPRNSLFIDE